MAKVLGFLLLAMAVLPAAAQSASQAPDPTLPKIFDTARYVYVEAEQISRSGRDLTPSDRQAIANLQKLLRDWGRYIVTVDRQNADLIFVVHKAATEMGNAPVVIGSAPRQPGRNPYPRDPTNQGAGNSGQDDGPGLIADSGSPDDQLAVYILNGSNTLTGPLWKESSRNGLARPKLTLFQHLKEDVEEAYPH